MKIHWDIFTDVGGRFGKKNISITANSGFGFSSGIFNDFKLKAFTHVILKYSQNQNFHFVGFEFISNAKTVGAIRLSKRGNFAQIGVHSFFKKYHLDPKKMKGSYPVEFEDAAENSKRNLFIKVPMQ